MSNGPTPPSALPTVTGTKRRSTPTIDTNRIDRYFVLERLGQGGMGVVVSAYDPELDRRVAIKLLQSPRDARGRLRLLREAQAMAKLSHPNVVHVYDVGTSGDQIYLAMELVVGQTVRAWLEAERRSWREVVRTFVAAGRGLVAAHAEGIVHRDFKPENVLVGRDGRVRVADFGIASLDALADPPLSPTPGVSSYLHHPITMTGGVVGTPRYMAPEQHAGLPVGPAADQFSFCVALHEALFGERPFVGDSMAELAENVAQERYRIPADPRGAPKWLTEVVRRGLRADPALRYPTVEALLERLEDDPAVRRRRRFRNGAGALALCSTLGIAAWSWAENAAQSCSGGEDAMAELWNDDVRAHMRGVFERGDDAASVAAAAAVQQTVDGWTEGWVQAHRQLCAAHRDGSMSHELFDASMACLSRDRGALERLLEIVTNTPGLAPERVASASAKLPRVADCTDPAALAHEVRPPPDSENAARVDALRARLAAAEVTHDAGDVAAAIAELDAIAAEAEALSYDPLTAEVGLVLGRLAMERSDFDDAHRHLPLASSRAIASGMDLVAAESEARRVFLDSMASDQPTNGLERVPLAGALVERVGDPPWLRAMMANNVGAVYGLIGDRERAEAEFSIAVELADHSGTVDPIEHASYASNLARMTSDPVRRDELFVRAEALVTKAVGPGHSDWLDHVIARALHMTDPAAATQLLAPACRQLAGREHANATNVHVCWWRLAELHEDLDDGRAALAAARSAVAAFEIEESLSPLHAAMRIKAEAYVAVLEDRPERALDLLSRAEELLGPRRDLHWVALLLADVTLLRARALDRLGRVHEVAPALRDALATYEHQTQVLEDRAAHFRRARVRALLAKTD